MNPTNYTIVPSRELSELLDRALRGIAAEIDELRRRSAVSAEPWPFGWADGFLHLRATLGVNDVYQFVIR